MDETVATHIRGFNGVYMNSVVFEEHGDKKEVT